MYPSNANDQTIDKFLTSVIRLFELLLLCVIDFFFFKFRYTYNYFVHKYITDNSSDCWFKRAKIYLF